MERSIPRLARVLFGAALLSVVVWLLLSLISSMGVSCGTEPCQSRADTGWLVLMALQVAWGAAAIALWRFPRFRYLGPIVGLVFPPVTFFLVTGVFYPPDFSL